MSGPRDKAPVTSEFSTPGSGARTGTWQEPATKPVWGDGQKTPVTGDFITPGSGAGTAAWPRPTTAPFGDIPASATHTAFSEDPHHASPSAVHAPGKFDVERGSAPKPARPRRRRQAAPDLPLELARPLREPVLVEPITPPLPLGRWLKRTVVAALLIVGLAAAVSRVQRWRYKRMATPAASTTVPTAAP